jgi:hypothetical protein
LATVMSSSAHVHPFDSVEEAITAVDNFTGEAEEFVLPISDKLQDSIGLNMALVTDRVLARGWMPSGFEQCAGFRKYKYRTSD